MMNVMLEKILIGCIDSQRRKLVYNLCMFKIVIRNFSRWWSKCFKYNYCNKIIQIYQPYNIKMTNEQLAWLAVGWLREICGWTFHNNLHKG
jgi:hypothetical protein